ncbi:HIRAN domain-containing protein [Methylomonas sp. AM2-LC]|uniref:HIRAN domain-containing protein n=1 Tax=Methylomonas sp. AM2-LC TaxID=3153301 RepID=UPI0032672AB4
MNFINHILQPSRLLLVWQSPEGKSRKRFVVGEVCAVEETYVFRYLPNTVDFFNAQNEGFMGYPAFRKYSQEYQEGVLDTFLRRVPPRKRGDFHKYLEQWRLAADINISDFALLGHTGAKLPNDGFSLINPFDGINAPYQFYIEVAGFRYYRESISLNDITIGTAVNFVLEPENDIDPNAVRIETLAGKFGYVNKVQCLAFNRWLKSSTITAWIERINGTDERPLIYILGQIDNINSNKIAA